MSKIVFICASSKTEDEKYCAFVKQQGYFPVGRYICSNSMKPDKSFICRMISFSNEFWLFGTVANEVMETELKWAEARKKKIRRFTLGMEEINAVEKTKKPIREKRLKEMERFWSGILRENEIKYYCKVHAYDTGYKGKYVADFYLPELDAYMDVIKKTKCSNKEYWALRLSKYTGKDVILAYEDGSFRFIDYRINKKLNPDFNHFIFLENKSVLAKCGICNKSYFRNEAPSCGCKHCGAYDWTCEVMQYGGSLTEEEIAFLTEDKIYETLDETVFKHMEEV